MSAERLRAAYEALLAGDPDPLVALMSDDMLWRGRKSGPWFWRPAPS
jgi:ketosteroid isomerase-like protein